jgi:replicative DNA helicase
MKVNDSMIPLPNSVDVEKAVIGAVLLDNNIFDDVSSVLGASNMFYKNAHRTIWYSILKLHEEGAPIDQVSLVQELISNKQIDNVGGAAYIAEISGEVATTTNALYHSKLVLESHKRRTLIQKLEEMTERAYNKGEDLGDIMGMMEDFDPSVAQSESCQSVSETIAGTFDEIENAFKNPGSVKGMNTGVTILNKLLGGWQPGEINILAARPSVGKALRMNESILTPTGWVFNKELKVGDAVASIDGAPSYVTGVFPQGKRMMYRMEFNNGRHIDSDIDHQWEIYATGKWGKRVVTTGKIMELLTRSRYKGKLKIRRFSGEFGVGSIGDMPIHPYLLGVLIGDGCLGSGSIKVSTADKEILNLIRPMLGCVNIVHDSNYDYRLSTPRGKVNWLLDALSKLKLKGTGSATKFIPEVYMNATKEVRLELLRGLMDTDGTVGKTTPSYTTISPQLSSDFQRLCESLGYIATTNTRITNYTQNGEKRDGKVSYRTTVRADDRAEIFNLQRKKDKCNKSSRISDHTIKCVYPLFEDECQCISVSHPDSLYITRNFIPTHNTAMALYSAMKCGVPSYFVSAEMSRRMVEHRLIGSYLGAPAHVLKSGHLKSEEYMKMQDAERHLKNIDMYIEDRIIDSGAIAKEARRLKREKDIGIIFIDYLQLLDPPKDESRKSATQNREREISIISSKLKMLAKELDIPVVALSQLSRESERLGRKPILSDLRESGSLEQDADVVIFLHRDNDLPDYVDCIIAKNRQGATGSETLRFRKDIGEFSEVRIGNE